MNSCDNNDYILDKKYKTKMYVIKNINTFDMVEWFVVNNNGGKNYG